MVIYCVSYCGQFSNSSQFRISLTVFFTSSNKHLFRFTSFCRFFDIMREIFDFSRLVLLISHSTQRAFKQQLLSNAIKNEQSQYKKKRNLNLKRDKPIKPNFRCPSFEHCSCKCKLPSLMLVCIDTSPRILSL